MRFSSPAQTSSHLTEKCILSPMPHEKPHSVPVMWIAQTAPFRYVAAPGKCGATPPPACGALWRMAQLGKCARATPRQPAGRFARGSANLGLSLTSRKSALWSQRLTHRRILRPGPAPRPASADPPHHGSGVCAVAQVVSLSNSVAYGVVAKFGTKLLSQRVDVHPHRVAEQIYVAVPGVGEQLLAADRSPAVT